MSEINWKKLRDYLCPICNHALKEIAGYLLEPSYHQCTKCDFHISDKKLCEMTVVKHRKLEPPAFIEEMKNQQALNEL